MGKRMITYLLVLGAVGYLFLMYIYPALSGLLIFCASVSRRQESFILFCGERTFCQSKAALGLRRKRTANESQYTGLQGKFSLDRKVQDSAGNGTCSIRHQTKRQLWLSEKQADYTFEPDRCGEWKLTITEVRIYDFIGILSVGKKAAGKGAIHSPARRSVQCR